GKRDQLEAGFAARGIELLGLGKRSARGVFEPKRVLAAAEFQPENEMAGVPFHGLLQEFHGKRELLVIVTDPRGEPGHEPIARREQLRLLKAIIRTRFLAGE